MASLLSLRRADNWPDTTSRRSARALTRKAASVASSSIRKRAATLASGPAGGNHNTEPVIES